MSITARHLAKRAPSPRYSMSRSRRPSSPSVMVSPGKAGERLRAEVDLDARDHALLRQVLREGRAVLGFLADGLIVENDAAHRLGRPGGGEQHLAVGAPMLLGRIELDAVEALLDRAGALVRGQDALALGDHRVATRLSSLGFIVQLLKRDRRVRRAERGAVGIANRRKRGPKDSKVRPRAGRDMHARAWFRRPISTKIVLVSGGCLHAAHQPAHRLRHRAARRARRRAGARADRRLRSPSRRTLPHRR